MDGNYFSPFNGQPLAATVDPNVFADEIGNRFLVNPSGGLTTMVSPMSAGTLTRNADGTFLDEYTGGTFSYDEEKNAFIPHYIPDDTNEPATIKDGQLVGLETGRTFDIDQNGMIMTPEEMTFQRNQGRSLIRLEQMKADGTVDSYLDDCRRRQEQARNRLESARANGTLDDLFRDAIDAEEVDHILLHFDEIVSDIPSQSQETLDELLQYFNSPDVVKNDRTFISYNDPVITSQLNDRYRELTGKDHPTYVEQIPSVITRYRENTETLTSIGGYFNDAYFEQLDGVYNNLIAPPEEGKEPTDLQRAMSEYQDLSRVERLRREHASLRVKMPEQYYEMEELKDRVESNDVTVADVRHLCDIAFGKDTPLSRSMSDAYVLSGSVKSSEVEYANSLQRQVNMFYGQGNPKANQAFNTVMTMRNEALRAQMYNEQMAKYGAPTEEMINDATKPELIDMRTQIYNNNPDLAYREEMREHYLSTREDGSYVVSKFDVIDGEQPVCQHSLELVSEQGKTVLQSKTFDYTEDFQHSILEPALTDYAECSPDMRATISSHLVEGVEWASADYRVISGNNNVMSVNNIPTEYAQEIASKVQQVEPVKFEAQQPLKEEQMNMGGHQYVLTKTGVASPLLLTLLLGFVLGLGIVLGFYIG